MKLSPSDIERFWSYVKEQDGCLVWQGSNTSGRGRFWLNGTMVSAARVAYFLEHGDIPKDSLLCRHCRNPSCVRPSHRFQGNSQDSKNVTVQQDRHARGEIHGSAVLTERQVLEIRSLARRNRLDRACAAHQYGVAKCTIDEIVQRRTWRHLPI